MTRKFEVELRQTVTIELDERVFQEVDEEWRTTFFNLRTPEEIARHVALNMTIRDCRLSEVEGFLLLDDTLVTLSQPGWDADTTEVDTENGQHRSMS